MKPNKSLNISEYNPKSEILLLQMYTKKNKDLLRQEEEMLTKLLTGIDL